MESEDRFIGKGSSIEAIKEEEVLNFPQCIVCEHLIDAEERTCEAYPEGIPDALFFGDVSHKKVYEGDNGILFEAIEEVLV